MATVRRPTVAVEPLWWAFLSGLGATPIFGGITRLLFLWLGPILLPPTLEHPEWISVNNLVVAVGAVAAGAVLIRAGGAVAFALYVGYELLRALAALPGRLALCASTSQLPRQVTGCDYLSLVSERWVTWVALLIGAALGIVWLRGRGGENGLLRAAGAFSLVLVAANTLLGLAFLGRGAEIQNAQIALFSLANVIGGGFAGVLLARERWAAAALLAVLIVAPGAALTLPLALQSANTIPFLLRWSGVYVPLLAAVAVVVTRGYVRRGDGGTFF